jgi:hypothetical protein
VLLFCAVCAHLLRQVYHPNIDLEGNICLNILREDWKPVLSISSVVYGLQFLFLVSCSTLLCLRLWVPVLAWLLSMAACCCICWLHDCQA